MTIQCLAIVGKNNEPLFLCDCELGDPGTDNKAYVEDLFGFFQEPTKGVENSLSLDNEVRLFICYV